MSNQKALTGVEIKDADKGLVQAVFSTFGVVDSDGDVTNPGAFENGAEVQISAYGHKSWEGVLPVGRGTIHTTDSEAILDGRFFIGPDDSSGREAFSAIKQLGGLQQWSYGYDTLEAEDGEHDGQKVQFLNKLKVHEVSPVLVGAGVATRTLAVKTDKLSFQDEAGHALGSVEAFISRAQALGSLRAEKDSKAGRVLSAANRERLSTLLTGLGDAAAAIDQLLAETDPDKHRNQLIREYTRYQRRLAEL